METHNIAALLEKYKKGLCSQEEEDTLQRWLHLYNLEGETGLSDQDFAEAEAAMLRNINAARFAKVRRIRYWPRMTAAVLIGFLLSAGIWFYWQDSDKEAVQQPGKKDIIRPGSVGATLMLSDGRKIRLAEAQGTFARENGVSISKAASGEVIYNVTGKGGGNQTNVLSTARGETFQVRLPDGSRVWLNAASSLSYPASFAGLNIRKVKLEGEGYFEVAQDKLRPFIVESDGQKVSVLGTHFNIEAYADEPRLTTTLLEGKVNVIKGGSSAILLPGQQSEVSKERSSGSISSIKLIRNANIDEAVAWKDNKFVFAGEDIRAVMRKLSRWYDIDPMFMPGTTTIGFGGSISRNKGLQDVLKVLELTKAVHFKMEGRKIIVMP